VKKASKKTIKAFEEKLFQDIFVYLDMIDSDSFEAEGLCEGNHTVVLTVGREYKGNGDVSTEGNDRH
jgi:hypothetical protein